jgi:hypothetical protein
VNWRGAKFAMMPTASSCRTGNHLRPTSIDKEAHLS